MVENDEDVELVFSANRIYAQIKTRSSGLVLSDIDGALSRFKAIRMEHVERPRSGDAEFGIISNSAPGPELAKMIEGNDWPSDVAFIWPGKSAALDQALPAPWPNLSNAYVACSDTASTLPFLILAPETLVWKLAGSGTQESPPR
ncbi:hypothetical protein X741_33185 [Mesorhizobium sp. LNHC229A00]|nr:hypothetical protein X741_33185 [Mesorhizobium sp. LNHC229A00]